MRSPPAGKAQHNDPPPGAAASAPRQEQQPTQQIAHPSRTDDTRAEEKLAASKLAHPGRAGDTVAISPLLRHGRHATEPRRNAPQRPPRINNEPDQPQPTSLGQRGEPPRSSRTVAPKVEFLGFTERYCPVGC